MRTGGLEHTLPTLGVTEATDTVPSTSWVGLALSFFLNQSADDLFAPLVHSQTSHPGMSANDLSCSRARPSTVRVMISKKTPGAHSLSRSAVAYVKASILENMHDLGAETAYLRNCSG